MLVQVPVSIGELMDKVSILMIKQLNISDEAKLANVERELDVLNAVLEGLGVDADRDVLDLFNVNKELWSIEDEIRKLGGARDHGDRFVELARLVYTKNDLRARIKRSINDRFGSDIVEEKQYQAY